MVWQSTQVKLESKMKSIIESNHKNNYYHNFKTWLESLPGLRLESRVKRVNSG